MARAKIELPETFGFTTKIEVRISDINYGGHVGNDAILSLIHEARVGFLHHHQMSEADAGGAGVIMTDAVVVYKAEVFYGTVLKVEVGVVDLTRTGCDCDFVFRLTDLGKGQEVARAKTGIVFFNYAQRKVVPVPEAFRQATGATRAK